MTKRRSKPRKKIRRLLRRFLPGAALTFFSSVICILLLEMICRMHFFGAAAFSFTDMNSIHPIGLSGLIQASPHPGVVYELRPNVDVQFKLTTFKTNSKGLRDKEYALEKPPDTFRVAVIGDSYTMPAGVRLEDAYHTLLEDQLNRLGLSRRFEFLNFGTGGYCIGQYLAVIKHKALPYDPDLILIGFSRADANIPDDKLYSQPYQVKKKTNTFFHLFAADWIRGKTLYKTIRKAILSQEETPEPAILESDDEEKFAYVDSVLGELKMMSEQHDFAVLVAYVAMDEEKSGIVRELTARHGLQFVDTSLSFKETRVSDHIIYPIDHHPNYRANQIFARVIYDYLVQEKLLGD